MPSFKLTYFLQELAALRTEPKAEVGLDRPKMRGHSTSCEEQTEHAERKLAPAIWRQPARESCFIWISRSFVPCLPNNGLITAGLLRPAMLS